MVMGLGPEQTGTSIYLAIPYVPMSNTRISYSSVKLSMHNEETHIMSMLYVFVLFGL